MLICIIIMKNDAKLNIMHCILIHLSNFTIANLINNVLELMTLQKFFFGFVGFPDSWVIIIVYVVCLYTTLSGSQGLLYYCYLSLVCKYAHTGGLRSLSCWCYGLGNESIANIRPKQQQQQNQLQDSAIVLGCQALLKLLWTVFEFTKTSSVVD